MPIFSLNYPFKRFFYYKTRAFFGVISIFLSMFLTMLLIAYQEGSHQSFLNTLLQKSIGKTQIHSQNTFFSQKEFQEKQFDKWDKILENTIFFENKSNHLQTIVLKSYEVQSSNNTKKFTNIITENIQKGKNLENNFQKKILIGKTFSKNNQLKIGDNLALNYKNKKEYFKIQGIIDWNIPIMDEQVILMSLQNAQVFLDCKDCLTQLISWKDTKKIPLKEPFFYKDWQEILPELSQMLEADKLVWFLMRWIIYIITSLGIFGIALMQQIERKEEFLMLYKIGVSSKTLRFWVFWELSLYFLIALFLTYFLGIPLLYYWQENPIYLRGELAKSLENLGLQAVLAVSLELKVLFSAFYIAFFGIVFSVFYALFFPIK